MSVRSALCLLVVLTCFLDNSVLAAIGGTCTTSENCRPVNDTACISGICVCIDSFVADSSNNQCLRKVGHGESCSESIQCIDLLQADCLSGTCQCVSSFTYNEQHCVGNIGLGQPCGGDAQCLVPRDPRQETVWCFNGQCACRGGYRRDDTRCVIGGDCTQDAECSNLLNSICDTRPRDRPQCTCAPTFIPVGNNTRCRQVVNTLGGGCDFDEECSSNLGRVVCINNQCRCAVGTSLQNDNTCGGAAVRIVVSVSCFVLVWMVKLL